MNTRKPNPQPKIQFTKLFINNTWVDSVSGKKFPTLNPATGKVIIEVSEADKADVDKAVAAAKSAFSYGSVWRQKDASSRGAIIVKLAELMEENINELASLEALDSGQPFDDAYRHILEATDVLRFMAGCADKLHGHTIPTDGGTLALTMKEPIGVVAAIIAWNYPIPLLSVKLGHALAAGCTIVIKPAEQTPLTALFVGYLILQAGFPPGVVNIIPGYGPTAGAALSEHPNVDKIAFTGSVPIGQRILEASANSNLKRVTLELGGKCPLVVFDDANLDLALNCAYMGIFSNAGQTCAAPSRVFVQTGVYDQFVEKFVHMASQIKIGGPFEPDVFQGPQIDHDNFQRILALIKSAIDEGAKLEIGGNRHGNIGYFIEPTVFTNVNDDMKIAKEETFGPVQCIFKFNTLEEVIRRANNSQYGLVAGVFTENLQIALEFAKAVQSGSIWINHWGLVGPQVPFGGYKMSGFGREVGIDSFDEYLNLKSVSINIPSNF